MEYNFTEKEEKRFINHFYQCYFIRMYLAVEKSYCQTISRETARKTREKLKIKSDREGKFASTLISSMLVGLGVKSPYRKYYYEEYDLMLLLMRYLHKDKLSIKDFAFLDIKKFYVDCLKSRFDKIDEIRDKKLNIPFSEEEEFNKLSREEENLCKFVIPTEEEYIENINSL